MRNIFKWAYKIIKMKFFTGTLNEGQSATIVAQDVVTLASFLATGGPMYIQGNFNVGSITTKFNNGAVTIPQGVPFNVPTLPNDPIDGLQITAGGGATVQVIIGIGQ